MFRLGTLPASASLIRKKQAAMTLLWRPSPPPPPPPQSLLPTTTAVQRPSQGPHSTVRSGPSSTSALDAVFEGEAPTKEGADRARDAHDWSRPGVGAFLRRARPNAHYPERREKAAKIIMLRHPPPKGYRGPLYKWMLNHFCRNVNDEKREPEDEAGRTLRSGEDGTGDRLEDKDAMDIKITDHRRLMCYTHSSCCCSAMKKQSSCC